MARRWRCSTFRDALADHPAPRDLIEVLPETGSTNAVLLARLAAGEAVPEGGWLLADRQTAGRGRAGRAWQDGAGNFMGSTVAHLRPADPPAPTLALLAGLALHRAVEETAPGLRGLALKWPNDLLLSGAKLAGILCERQDNAVVVGIGVNLVAAPDLPDRATTSLSAHDVMASRDGFAGVLARLWADLHQRWHGGQWDALRGEWIARAHGHGTLLAVREPDGTMLSGTFAGLEPDGTALLRLASGVVRAIHAGDIELMRVHAAGN